MDPTKLHESLKAENLSYVNVERHVTWLVLQMEEVVMSQRMWTVPKIWEKQSGMQPFSHFFTQQKPCQTSIYRTIAGNTKRGKWSGLRNKHSLEWEQDHLPLHLSACLLHSSLSGDWLSLLLQLLCLNKSFWEFLRVLSNRSVTPRKDCFSPLSLIRKILHENSNCLCLDQPTIFRRRGFRVN